MKYVVAVNASPRTGWNTAMLAKKAAEGAEAAGAQVGCLQQKAGAICDCDPGEVSRRRERILFPTAPNTDNILKKIRPTKHRPDSSFYFGYATRDNTAIN